MRKRRAWAGKWIGAGIVWATFDLLLYLPDRMEQVRVWLRLMQMLGELLDGEMIQAIAVWIVAHGILLGMFFTLWETTAAVVRTVQRRRLSKPPGPIVVELSTAEGVPGEASGPHVTRGEPTWRKLRDEGWSRRDCLRALAGRERRRVRKCWPDDEQVNSRTSR